MNLSYDFNPSVTGETIPESVHEIETTPINVQKEIRKIKALLAFKQLSKNQYHQKEDVVNLSNLALFAVNESCDVIKENQFVRHASKGEERNVYIKIMWLSILQAIHPQGMKS